MKNMSLKWKVNKDGQLVAKWKKRKVTKRTILDIATLKGVE